MSALLLCLVIAISDGDTLTARCGEPGAYQQIKIRLSEIDAPEKAQPFGERSRQHLAQLCHGQTAGIRSIGTDRYGRTLARVECQGKDANAEQVRDGLAWVYDRYVTDRSLYQLQDAARSAGLGLRADRNPVPPWDWRQRKKRD